MVCTHPATGRLHLYVNRPFVSHIEGLDRESSLELLDRLCRQADAPEHQCRFTWTKDAVAFWDNRAVQHYASSDYWPQPPLDGARLGDRDGAQARLKAKAGTPAAQRSWQNPHLDPPPPYTAPCPQPCESGR